MAENPLANMIFHCDVTGDAGHDERVARATVAEFFEVYPAAFVENAKIDVHGDEMTIAFPVSWEDPSVLFEMRQNFEQIVAQKGLRASWAGNQGSEQRTSAGSFVSRVISMFTSPGRVFDDIDAGMHWWQPWLWVSVINGIVAYISLPIQIHLKRINPGDLTEEQLAETIAALHKFAILVVISAPVGVLVQSALIAGIGYIVVSVLAESATFKKFFTLYLCCFVIPSAGMLLGTIVTRMKGVENIRSLDDAMVSFGPATLLDSGHKILQPILENFDVFSVWFYVLLGLGAMRVFRLNRINAAIVVVPVWLVFVLFLLIRSRLVIN